MVAREERFIVTGRDGRLVHFEPTGQAIRWKGGSLRLLTHKSGLVVAATGLADPDHLGDLPDDPVRYFGLRVPLEELGRLLNPSQQRFSVTIGVVRSSVDRLADPRDFPYMIENRARASRALRAMI